MNITILHGRVGKDPETREVKETKVSNFTLATSEKWKDKNGSKQEKTEWHNIVCWRGLASLAEGYIQKGAELIIIGKTQTRSWDDNDGNKRYMTEVVVDKIDFCGSKSDKGQVQKEAKPDALGEPENDLPF